MVKLARTGPAPATDAAAAAMNAEESEAGVCRVPPFRLVDQIPKDTAMLYLDDSASTRPLARLARLFAMCRWRQR